MAKVVVITYDGGTGIPKCIRGEVMGEDDAKVKVKTSTGRVFIVPAARFYRVEIISE